MFSKYYTKRLLRTAVVGMGFYAACGFAAAASGYQFSKFEDPRGWSTSFYPTGINNSLVVAGTASFQHGFMLSGGSVTIFDVPSAYNNQTFGDDINNSGVVVGAYRNGSGAHGFTLDNGVYSSVDVPGAWHDTIVTGINDQGQLVGQYRQVGTGNMLGFVKSGNNFSLFDAAQAQPNTFANGINNAGQVVGYVGGGGTSPRGFTYANGVFEFFDAPGALTTQAMGINNSGQIVGTASTGVFVKDGAAFTTLALPDSWNATNAYATDITDDGVVVGYFIANTNLTYGFLATPLAAVPEPSSAILMLAGGVLVCIRRRAAHPGAGAST